MGSTATRRSFQREAQGWSEYLPGLSQAYAAKVGGRIVVESFWWDWAGIGIAGEPRDGTV